MKHYRDCITSSLQSLSMGYGKHKELSTLIVRAVQEILGLSEDFTESLKGRQQLFYIAGLLEAIYCVLGDQLYSVNLN